ncbi:alpha/beta fold hydrolase [Streptomyces sp. MMG1121]|uniref:alpha/beta fold hydrolase n=1 Tax=Streptomyces sp. MMG1121 TaxID=1415544 RepID=UPI0006AE4C23|nr:alpha/beta hydrolase [Streptomyces sp. MMG1121]
MSTELDGFEHAYARVNGVRLHYVIGGSGDPLVLLPGWPRTWWQYRKVMPALAEHFRVIVCEYRGMGDSEKPEAGYGKANMAQDIYELVRHLGYDQVNIAGEDVGSWIAYFFAATHPESTWRLAMWDPGAPDPVLASLSALPASAETNAWHFGFNQLDNLPEQLLADRYHILMDWLAEEFAVDPEAIDRESRAIYARAYDSPEAIRAVAGWYRTLSQDIQEAAHHPKLSMPVLVPGGKFLELSRASNEHRATDIRFVEIPGAGHYLSEERPEQLSRELITFFSGNG